MKTNITQRMKDYLETANGHFHTRREERIAPTLTKAVKDSQIKANIVWSNLCSTIAGGTWKAIARRDGFWETKKNGQKVTSNWNNRFVKTIMITLTPKWHLYVDQDIHGIHILYANNIAHELRKFAEHLKQSFSRICGDDFQPIQGLLPQIELIANQVIASIMDSFIQAKKQAGEATRAAFRMVVEKLKPYYQVAKMEKGIQFHHKLSSQIRTNHSSSYRQRHQSSTS